MFQKIQYLLEIQLFLLKILNNIIIKNFSFVKKVFYFFLFFFIFSYFYSIYSSDYNFIFRLILIPFFFLLTLVFINYSKMFLKNTKKILRSNVLYFIIFIGILIFFFLKLSKFYFDNYELMDLGINLNKIWRLNQLDLIGVLKRVCFESNFQPIILINIILFKIFKQFELILLFQTIILLSSAYIIYLIGKEINLKKFYIIVSIFIFIWHPFLLFNDLLGYVPDSLIIFFSFLAFLFYEKNKLFLFLLSIFLISLSGHVYFLTSAFFGLFFYFDKKNKIGLIIFALFLALFLIVLLQLENQSISPPSTNIVGAYGVIIKGSVKEIFHETINFKKIIYFFYIFCPLFLFYLFYRNLKLFLPIIILIPEFFKSFLSTTYLHYSLDGHYTAMYIPVIIYIFLKIILFCKIKIKLSFSSILLIIFMNISHGASPLAINFWSKSSNEAFNFKNYYKSKFSKSDNELIFNFFRDLENFNIQISNNSFSKSFLKAKKITYFSNKGLSVS